MRHPTLWPLSLGARRSRRPVSPLGGNPLSAKGNSSCCPEPVGAPECQEEMQKLELAQFPHLPFIASLCPISSWTRAGGRAPYLGMCLSGPSPFPSPPLSWWSWSLGVGERRGARCEHAEMGEPCVANVCYWGMKPKSFLSAKVLFGAVFFLEEWGQEFRPSNHWLYSLWAKSEQLTAKCK